MGPSVNFVSPHEGLIYKNKLRLIFFPEKKTIKEVDNLKWGNNLKMCQNFENGSKFWKWIKIWKKGQYFENGSKIWKCVKKFENGSKFWKWVKILKIGQNFENGAKFSKRGKKKIRGARHMRVKCASSARESCAGIRASFTNDAYASNARHLCTRTRKIPEAHSFASQRTYSTETKKISTFLFLFLYWKFANKSTTCWPSFWQTHLFCFISRECWVHNVQLHSPGCLQRLLLMFDLGTH